MSFINCYESIRMTMCTLIVCPQQILFLCLRTEYSVVTLQKCTTRYGPYPCLGLSAYHYGILGVHFIMIVVSFLFSPCCRGKLLFSVLEEGLPFRRWNSKMLVAWLEVWVGVPFWYIAAIRNCLENGQKLSVSLSASWNLSSILYMQSFVQYVQYVQLVFVYINECQTVLV